jgi:hypothetical protein
MAMRFCCCGMEYSLYMRDMNSFGLLLKDENDNDDDAVVVLRRDDVAGRIQRRTTPFRKDEDNIWLDWIGFSSVIG